jgi:hypothetical protein
VCTSCPALLAKKISCNASGHRGGRGATAAAPVTVLLLFMIEKEPGDDDDELDGGIVSFIRAASLSGKQAKEDYALKLVDRGCRLQPRWLPVE